MAQTNTFQTPFPERQVSPPHIHGTAAPTNTILHQMRRQQLQDLARAYGITVDRNGTKDQIMPTMIDAEQRGVFRGPVVDQHYFLKAQRDPDQVATPITISPNPEVQTSPAPMPPSVDTQPTSSETPELESAPPVETDGRKASPKMQEFHALRAKIKAIGLDPTKQGMTKDRMEQIVAEHSQSNPRGQGPGVPGQDGLLGEPRNLESGQAD